MPATLALERRMFPAGRVAKLAAWLFEAPRQKMAKVNLIESGFAAAVLIAGENLVEDLMSVPKVLKKKAPLRHLLVFVTYPPLRPKLP